MIRDDTYIQPCSRHFGLPKCFPLYSSSWFPHQTILLRHVLLVGFRRWIPASFLFVSERTLFYNYEIWTPLGLSYENHVGDRCICLKFCLWQVPNFDLSISTKNRLATRQMMKVVFLNFIHRPEHQGRHRPKFYSNDARDNLNPTLGQNFFWKDFLLIFGWNDLMIMKWQCLLFQLWNTSPWHPRRCIDAIDWGLACYLQPRDGSRVATGRFEAHGKRRGDHGWKMNIIFVWFIFLPYDFYL